jgi:hypothetical protein
MRLHAPEIEDEPWCPTFLRDALTDFLTDSADVLGIYDAAAPTIADLVRRHGAGRLVDLCSGAGGPALRTRERLQQHHGVDVELVLTDLYPNRDAFARAFARSAGRVQGRSEPTDAACVPDDIVGVRTIFNGFHHFRPALARRIVEDAARKRQPFISVEIVERRFLTVATIAGTPLLSLLLALRRPYSPARLVCSTIAPVVPAAILWDGLMSCLRAYAVDELRALTADLESDDYGFRVEQVPTSLVPMRITMLIGEPRS